MVTKNPLFEISEKEAATLAQAIKDVMKYHSIAMSAQTAAYVKLLTVAAAIYGPKLYMVYIANKSKPKKPVVQKQPESFDMPLDAGFQGPIKFS